MRKEVVSDRVTFRHVLACDHLDHRAGLPTGDLQQQAGGALHGAVLQFKIDAAFKTMRRVGMHGVVSRPADDGLRRKPGTFQEQIRRIVANAGIDAPHDSGDGAACTDHGNHRIGVWQRVGKYGDDPAQQVKDHKPRVSHRVFNVIAKDPEKPHIPHEVRDASMQEE